MDNIDNMKENTQLINQINLINLDLGIDLGLLSKRNLKIFKEASNCIDAGLDKYNRMARLAPEALKPWQQMVAAAKQDSIDLIIFSSFRDYNYQAGLIKNKLNKGQKIEEIIKVLAPPGYSEHHTGCAIDITSYGLNDLSERFETTKSFDWLTRYANQFGFYMSYPKDNPYGFIYEPWHWCFKNN